MATKMIENKCNIQKVYHDNPDLKKEDVEILEKWINKQPHLPEVTELQLITFLHSCYYRIEATKVTIDNFFTLRTLTPELFYLPTVEEIIQNFSVGYVNLN